MPHVEIERIVRKCPPKSIALIHNNDVIVVREGYGGYVLYASQLGSSDMINVAKLLREARAYLVDSETDSFLSNVEKIEVAKRVGFPTDLAYEFDARIVRYILRPCKVEFTKITPTYAVLEPKPSSNNIVVKAVEFVRYTGRRSPHAIVKAIQSRYPDNEAVLWLGVEPVGKGRYGIVARFPLEERRNEEGEGSVKAAMEEGDGRKAVVIRGFLVVSRLPSRELLTAKLPEIFEGVKIGKKDIRLVVGYFYNKLASLSRDFYTRILPRYAVDAGFGYIVPFDKAPEFLKEVDALRREYEKFEHQLKRFLLTGEVDPEIKANKRAKVDPEYVKLVWKYIEQHGLADKVRQRIEQLKIADRMMIRLLPFYIDFSLIEEYMDEKLRQRIETELEAVKQQVVDAVRSELEERLRNILERLKKYAETEWTREAYESFRHEVEEVKRMAEEFAVDLPLLHKIEAALENPAELAEISVAGDTRLEALRKIVVKKNNG